MDAITAKRPDTQQEIKNFRVLGHDPSAAWGGGSIVEVENGHAYVGRGRHVILRRAGGFHGA